MGFGSRALLAGSLGFAAAFAVACGGSTGLLTTDQSSTLSGQLDAVSNAVTSGNCGAAHSAASALTNVVAGLPPSVSTQLVQNLGQGAATVSALATKDCSSSSSSSSSSTSSSSSPTTTTTSTVSTTTTVTNPSSSTTTASGSGTATATNTNPSGTSTAPSGGAGLGTGTSGKGGGQ